MGSLGGARNPDPGQVTDFDTWKADLEARHLALKAEESQLMAALDSMDPLIGARAFRALADRMEALETEWLQLAEEARARGQG